MLICIPTNGDKGLEDVVSDHFGSANYFTLVDSETGKIDILENSNSHHSHGTCHPMTQLESYHLNGVVCKGMGRRAVEALVSQGIEVYTTGKQNVGEIVEIIKEDKLEKIDPAKACMGHGHIQAKTHREQGIEAQPRCEEPNQTENGRVQGGLGQGPGHTRGNDLNRGTGRGHGTGAGIGKGSGRGRGRR